MNNKTRAYNEPVAHRIVGRVNAGQSVAAAARAEGLSEKTVWNWMTQGRKGHGRYAWFAEQVDQARRGELPAPAVADIVKHTTDEDAKPRKVTWPNKREVIMATPAQLMTWNRYLGSPEKPEHLQIRKSIVKRIGAMPQAIREAALSEIGWKKRTDADPDTHRAERGRAR